METGKHNLKGFALLLNALRCAAHNFNWKVADETILGAIY